jgi:hypothetical protein
MRATHIQKRIEQGLCTMCGKNKPAERRITCKQCSNYTYQKRKLNNSDRKYYQGMKDKIYAAYGGYICKCCGETEHKFLTIDHINNNGAEQRRLFGKQSQPLYRWIIKNNFPPGFQILCQSCNMGKYLNNNQCPHITIITNLLIHLSKIDLTY